MSYPINPYKVGPPLHNDKEFFGRKDVLDWVTREIQSQASNVILLFGQRRIGKTSILLRLRTILKGAGFLSIYFDLQDKAQKNLCEVLSELAKEICILLDLEKPDVKRFDNEGIFFKNSFLPEVSAQLKATESIVFLFDEFDVIEDLTEEQLPSTSAAKSFFSFIRLVANSDERCIFVFALGRHSDDLSRDFSATFKSALTKEVWTLDPESALALVKSAENNESLFFSEQATDRLLSITSCHPYFLQLLCQRIWQNAYRNIPDTPPLIPVETVNELVQDALDVGDQALEWLWDGLSPTEKIYASALAEISEEGDSISGASVREVLEAHAARLSASGVTKVKVPKDLVKRRVLEEPQKDRYCFAIEFFRIWVKKRRPLSIVKNQLDKINPQAERLYQLGRDYLMKSEFDKAFNYLQDSLQINGSHFQAQLALGETRLGLGDLAEAVQEFEKAYVLDQIEAQYPLVEALLKLGQEKSIAHDWDAAITAYTRVTRITDNPDLRQICSTQVETFRMRRHQKLRRRYIWLCFVLLISVPLVFSISYHLFGLFAPTLFITGLYTVTIISIVYTNYLLKHVLPHYRYRQRYLEFLRFRCRSFDVKGLSTQGPYSLSLEQVYVEFEMVPQAIHQVTDNPVAPSNLAKDSHTIWEYLGAKEIQNLVVIGAPGSGKTTLLRHMVLTLARRKQQSATRYHRKLPILLFLRNHAETILQRPDISLVEIIHNGLEHNMEPPGGWFETLLNKGGCLVMLDGLDEVADSKTQKRVVDWAEREIARYNKNQFVITSRPYGYRSNPLSGVHILEVRPFSSKQVREFVHNWYLANEIKSQQRDDPGVEMDAEAGAEDLLKRIHNTKALYDMAVNPLLLTMIANVHRFRSSLPGRRVELYAEICVVFLGRRQEARGIEYDLTPALKQRVLQPLAHHMMRHNLREINVDEAIGVIAEALKQVSPESHGAAFLKMIENTSGLLVERESTEYAFAHLTFQEFLTAVDILDRRLDDELLERVGDSWWQETILLYSAQADASRIVAACLDSNPLTVPILALAVQCIEEAHQVDPGLRAQVESVLNQWSEDKDGERRRLAAEVRLRIRLEQ